MFESKYYRRYQFIAIYYLTALCYSDLTVAQDYCALSTITSDCSRSVPSGSGSAGNTKSALDSVINNNDPNSELVKQLVAIESLSTDEQEQVYRSIASDESSLSTDAVTKLGGTNTSIISARINALRTTQGQAYYYSPESGLELFSLSGGSAGSELESDNFLRGYFKLDYDFGDVDSTALQAGYDFDVTNITLGIDYSFDNQYIAGVALGIPRYKYKFEDTSKTELSGTIFTGYVSYFRDSWYLDWVVSYADLEMDTERKVSNGFESVTVSSDDVGSDMLSMSIGGGYSIRYLNYDVGLEALYQYINSSVDGYTETASSGVNDTLLLTLSDVDNIKSSKLVLGANISYPYSTSFGVVQPFLRTYFHFEFENGGKVINSRFKNDPSGTVIPIVTDEVDGFYNSSSLGTTLILPNNWISFIEYSAILGLENVTSHSFSIGISHEF